ncbi:MAG: N-acetylmuramoyl-L-alanine amidase [Elusimicrobiota bacterium]
MTPPILGLPRRLILAGVILALASAAAHAKPFLVLLDPGHTPQAPGATSSRGTTERTFNQNIARLLMEKLAAVDGLRAATTNGPDENVGLSERPKLANELKADLFISLHHDSVQPQFLKSWDYDGASRKYCDEFSGYSIFVAAKNPSFGESSAFARIAANKLEQKGLAPSLYHAQDIPGEGRTLLDASLGIYDRSDLAVLRENKRPAILLECGFIVNRGEEERLRDPAYQSLLVDALYDAVLEYKRSVEAR